MGRVLAGLVIGMVCASCVCGGAPAFAAPSPPPATTATPFLQTGDIADIPPGFIGFCVRFADQCQLPPNASQTVPLTKDTLRTLKKVNYSVNSSIWPEDDSVHFGRAEYWTIATDGRGNCNDYALTKRKALIDAGLPAAALRIAIVNTPDGERHVVLTVATDQGDYVLDNLSDDVVMWNFTGYTWIERQDPTRPFGWVSLQPPTRLTAAYLVAGADAANLASIIAGRKPTVQTPGLALGAIADFSKFIVLDQAGEQVVLADDSTEMRFGRDITGRRLTELFSPDKSRAYIAARQAMTLQARLHAFAGQLHDEAVRLYGLVPDRVRIWAFLGAFILA
jgi:predicted transglutaminase-like cysteine proteinase